MSGKARLSLRQKTLENVKYCNLSQTDKECIAEVFKRYEEAAAEKQIPKKPANEKRFFAGVYIGNCPNCWGNVRNAEMFCSDCGQALDWSDFQ